MTRTIEVLILPTGEIRLQTKGFTGSSCQTASRDLELALGLPTHDQRTPEYFQTEVSVQREKQRP